MGMTTYTGDVVSLESGVPSLFSIGVSLGRIVRFTGHLRCFYPVLAHSLVVAALMSEEIGIYGLMHDSQESIFSDVPTPVKSEIARNRERKVQKRIFIALGIPAPSEKTMDLLEEADHAALVAEAIVLGHKGEWGTDYDPIAGKLTKTYANPKKILNWLDADYSGKFFENTFKKYAKLAGLDATSWS